MNEPRLIRPCSLVEIARVLMKERRKDCMAQIIARAPIPELCRPTFAIPCGALAVTGKRVIRLFNACRRADTNPRGPIKCVVRSKGELLFRSKGSRVLGVTHIEVRDDAEQTLLLFRLDLFSSDHFRGTNRHLRRVRGNR